MKKNKIRRILIIRVERIGDYCITVPALKMLRDNFPKAQIDIVVLPMIKPLADATPYVDNVFTFNNPLLETNTHLDILKKYLLNYSKLRKFWKEFSKKQYDLVVSFSYRQVSEILLNKIESKIKMSAKQKNLGDKIEVERCQSFLRERGLKKLEGKVKLNVSEADKKFVRKNFKNKKRRIVIHPWTYLDHKNWSEEKWVSLIKKIIKEKNSEIYLVGGKNDKIKVDKIYLKVNKKNVKNLCGELNLIQTYDLIDNSDIIIGADSFGVHCAEITKAKILTLGGRDFQNNWSPPKKQGRVIKGKNINNIPVDKVFETYKKLMKNNT